MHQHEILVQVIRSRVKIICFQHKNSVSLNYTTELQILTPHLFQIFCRLNVDDSNPKSLVSNASKDIPARFITFDNSMKEQ